MDLPTGLGARLRQRFQKASPVLVVVKNRLPPVAPVHDVVNGAGILDSQLARHVRGILAEPPGLSNANWPIAGTDPSTRAARRAPARSETGHPRDRLPIDIQFRRPKPAPGGAVEGVGHEEIVTTEARAHPRDDFEQPGNAGAGTVVALQESDGDRITHEIRNGIKPIAGSLDVLLQEKAISGQNRRLLEIATRECKRVGRFIQALLDYGRVTPLVLEPVDQRWGERVAYLEDPDGNLVMLTA